MDIRAEARRRVLLEEDAGWFPHIVVLDFPTRSLAHGFAIEFRLDTWLEKREHHVFFRKNFVFTEDRDAMAIAYAFHDKTDAALFKLTFFGAGDPTLSTSEA